MPWRRAKWESSLPPMTESLNQVIQRQQEVVDRLHAEIERLRTLLTSEGICLECGSRGCDCQEGEY